MSIARQFRHDISYIFTVLFVSWLTHWDPCIYAFHQRDQSSARSVNPAPGRQLQCLNKGHLNRHDYIYSVHTARPIFICFFPLCFYILLMFILESSPARYTEYNQRVSIKDTTSNFAATLLLLVLNTFQSLLFLRCCAFMFMQAQPRCRGNKITVIFSVEWCKMFLLLWQCWPILIWAFKDRILVCITHPKCEF